MAKIDAVTAEEVQELARELFRPDRLNLALLGPYTRSSAVCQAPRVAVTEDGKTARRQDGESASSGDAGVASDAGVGAAAA